MKPQALDILRSNKLRVTEMRKKVLETFINHPEALSSRDIELSLDQADRITLYRTLKTFEDKGIIHVAHDSTQTQKYAICSSGCSAHMHRDEHVHFHCQSCGKTFCIDEISVPEIAVPQKYAVEAVNLIVSGKCDKCNSVA